ncbi:hypothetical protein pb186bvf_013346 [Paramecium bursaria]
MLIQKHYYFYYSLYDVQYRIDNLFFNFTSDNQMFDQYEKFFLKAIQKKLLWRSHYQKKENHIQYIFMNILNISKVSY